MLQSSTCLLGVGSPILQHCESILSADPKTTIMKVADSAIIFQLYLRSSCLIHASLGKDP
jgi:hypothetical protein